MTAEPSAAVPFYAAIPEDAAELMAASKVRGLDEEIALLRVRLKREMKDHPQSFDVILKGVRLLVQAMVARYRLGPGSAADLQETLEAALRNVKAEFTPPETDDV